MQLCAGRPDPGLTSRPDGTTITSFATGRPGSSPNGTPGEIKSIFQGEAYMLNLKRNLLSAALASAMFMVATHAQADAAMAQGPQSSDSAQNADQSATQGKDGKKADTKRGATKLQAVEVSGFVSSLENSTAVKRNADSIVEAVSAEQIGKLPGVSIAPRIICSRCKVRHVWNPLTV